MKRTLGAIGIVGLAACARDGAMPGGDRVEAKTTAADLIADRTGFTGEDLGPKELALTFDDGPGPMEVSGALAEWLHQRPVPIRATFFVNGACIQKTPLSSSSKNASCGEPTPNAAAVLAKEIAEGHYVGNHTTTHRDLVTNVFANDGAPGVVAELTETDELIAPYLQAGRMFFRAPFGSYDQHDFSALENSPMGKYVGPIYWTEGGGPTDDTRAADWECWQVKNLTTRQCGDLYLEEIAALGNRGIVLMHDLYGNTSNHDIDHGVGNTFDMVKYIVPQLEAQGFSFKRLDQVPAIAAALPAGASEIDAGRELVDGGSPGEGEGEDVEVNAGGAPSEGTSPEPLPSKADDAPPRGSGVPVASSAGKHDAGCNAAGVPASGSSLALVALGYLALRRVQRRRR